MPRIADVERCMESIYVASAGAHLRDDDRRKARQVTALLDEVGRVVCGVSRRTCVTVVDAAAGKAYVGLLAARLVLETVRPDASVVTIEREVERVRASRAAADLLGTRVAVECRCGDVGDARLWPETPTLVVALHACGPAADRIIDVTIAQRARTLLLVPCCTSRAVVASTGAAALHESLGLPRHAPIRTRFEQAVVDATRTLRLEAAGYETEVVEFVGAIVTPHNLLWRARRVGEPGRMAEAAARLRRLRGAADAGLQSR